MPVECVGMINAKDVSETRFAPGPPIDTDYTRRFIVAHEHAGFDKLVLCTGFVWEQPDVPGANLEGLHYVKDIRRAMEFDKQLDSMKRAVVIGGMWLGVEMAGALARHGGHRPVVLCHAQKSARPEAEDFDEKPVDEVGVEHVAPRSAADRVGGSRIIV